MVIASIATPLLATSDDAHCVRGTCRLTIGDTRCCAPIVQDLLQPTPIQAIEPPYRVLSDRIVVESVPLYDSPVVVRAFAR
jgi:hypothetical protein